MRSFSTPTTRCVARPVTESRLTQPSPDKPVLLLQEERLMPLILWLLGVPISLILILYLLHVI
jgi:hypothetical protein